MLDTPRRPLARMEVAQSMVVKSVRIEPRHWELFVLAARERGRSDVSAFFRDCAAIGLDYLPVLERVQSHTSKTRITAG